MDKGGAVMKYSSLFVFILISLINPLFAFPGDDVPEPTFGHGGLLSMDVGTASRESHGSKYSSAFINTTCGGV